VLSCCLSSTGWYILFVGWVVPSASVVAVEVPVDSQMTISGLLLLLVMMISCHLGYLLHVTVLSAKVIG
jgi:hypothetical protein